VKNYKTIVSFTFRTTRIHGTSAVENLCLDKFLLRRVWHVNPDVGVTFFGDDAAAGR
jgi:hypothetical protein